MEQENMAQDGSSHGAFITQRVDCTLLCVHMSTATFRLKRSSESGRDELKTQRFNIFSSPDALSHQLAQTEEIKQQEFCKVP